VIVVVHGPDAALVRETVEQHARRHDSTGESTSRLDGKSASLPEIVAQIASPGFFGAGRVVVVFDLLARTSKATRDDGADEPGDGRSKSAATVDVGALFAAVAPGNLLILADPTLAALPAAVRKALPSDAVVVGCEPPRGAALVQWIQRAAQQEGTSIDPATARFLAERLYPLTWANAPSNPRFDVPPDLDRLGGEVAKLALAAHPHAIGREHVSALVASGEADQIFRFAESAARGALGAALTELRRLLDAGEEPYAVAAQLHQQAELATVLEAAGNRVEPATIGRDLGLSSPGRLHAIAGSRRGQPAGTARTLLSDCRAVDRQVKRGELRDPVDALYALLARAARPSREMQRGGR
jgi:DNA polymerase III delta subunit